MLHLSIQRLPAVLILLTVCALFATSASAQSLRLWSEADIDRNACRKYSGWATVEDYTKATNGHSWPYELPEATHFIEHNMRHLNSTLAGQGRKDEQLLARLLHAARSKSFTSVAKHKGGSSPSHVNGVVVKSVAYAVAYLQSRNAISSDDLNELDGWVRQILRTIDKAQADDSKASNGVSRMAWGAVMNDRALYDKGRTQLLRIADNIKNSATYDSNLRVANEVIQHLVQGATILALNGETLYLTSFGSRTFDEAVQTHAAAVVANGANKVSTKDDPTARSIFRMQGYQTHLAWVPMYLANRSGNGGDVAALDRALRKVDRGSYNGLSHAIHAGCYFGG